MCHNQDTHLADFFHTVPYPHFVPSTTTATRLSSPAGFTQTRLEIEKTHQKLRCSLLLPAVEKLC